MVYFANKSLRHEQNTFADTLIFCLEGKHILSLVVLSERESDPAAAVLTVCGGRPYVRMITVSQRIPRFADAMIVCPSYRGTPPLPDGFRCNVAALPGNAVIPGLNFGHGAAVSYGMSAQDTVTFSSINKNSSVLAVRREIVTVSGRIIERQEFSVFLPPHLEPSEALAYLSALLILDRPLPSDSIFGPV